jgi:predicted nucleic acid-binding protein
MTNAITFDAGALIAIERRSRRMQALLSELDRREWQVAVPAGAVGLLCGRSGHPGVVDVSVAICARERNLHVVTSDPEDLRAIDGTLILHVP